MMGQGAAMTRRRYLIGLLLLVAILIVIRLILPPLGVRGPLFARLEAVGFAVALTVIAVTALAALRLRHAGLSLLWAVPVLLWLAGSEPAIRAVMGGADPHPGGLPGPVGSWFEIPAMLAIFLGFLGLYQRGVPLSRLERVAAAAAVLATIARPLLIVGGLDRLLGGLVSLPGETLTFLLRLETWFTAVKGLFIFPGSIGGAALFVSFAAALAAMLFGEQRRAVV
jgi:uncharacterized membrane protein YhaH (DUF805 family)